MRVNAPRLGLLFVSFLLIALAVAACAAQGPTSATTGGNAGPNDNVFQTPNPALNTPTPTFPGFTVGAWPSQYSPGNNASITIYVICRIQDPTMQTPPKVAPGVPVVLTFSPAATIASSVSFPTMSESTGQDGIAAFNVQVNDPSSGVPIEVQALATYDGTTYVAQTFFTPNPEAKPTPTAGPAATATAAATATP